MLFVIDLIRRKSRVALIGHEMSLALLYERNSICERVLGALAFHLTYDLVFHFYVSLAHELFPGGRFSLFFAVECCEF